MASQSSQLVKSRSTNETLCLKTKMRVNKITYEFSLNLLQATAQESTPSHTHVHTHLYHTNMYIHTPQVHTNSYSARQKASIALRKSEDSPAAHSNLGKVFCVFVDVTIWLWWISLCQHNSVKNTMFWVTDKGLNICIFPYIPAFTRINASWALELNRNSKTGTVMEENTFMIMESKITIHST